MTAFRWVLLSDPKIETGTSPEFETQQDAEDWMGAEWRQLLEEGSLAARLERDGEELYTMKLTED